MTTNTLDSNYQAPDAQQADLIYNAKVDVLHSNDVVQYEKGNYSSETTYNNDEPKLEGLDDEQRLEGLDDKENMRNGELCTYQIAENYNIAENQKFDTNIITKLDQEKIDRYIDDDKEYEYSLCNRSDDGKDFYYNCALDKKNIWLTKDTNNKCKINENIALPPDKLEKIDNILLLKKPDSFTAVKNLSNSSNDVNILCNERWYDWFTIPDYHNGNKYSKEINGDTYTCYKPCNFGSIISSDTNNNSAFLGENKNKCINRDLIDNGRLKNTLLFTPYAIIFLFGLTKNDLIDLYKYELDNIQSIVDENNKNSDKLYDYEINNNLFKAIKENDTTLEKIVKDLKTKMQTSIKQLVTEPISHLNIIPPYDNLGKLNQEPKKYYNNEKYIKKAYEIATKLNKYLSDVSLKSDFYSWKKQLEEINGFDINSWEFNKILLLLQSSCMLCFGYQNPIDILFKKQKDYNEYIFQKIVRFNDDNNTFSRINFPRIKNSQILKSIDTKNPFNNVKDDTLTTLDSNKIKEYQIRYSDDGTIDDIANDKLSINKYDFKFFKYDGTTITNKDELTDTDIERCVNQINIDMIDNSFSSYLINTFNSCCVIMVMILFVFMSYLLLILIWPNFANVVNYIILGFIWTFAVFIGIFQRFMMRAPNSKGLILQIHQSALKMEFFTGQFMKNMTIIHGGVNPLPLYIVLGIAGTVIFLVMFKAFYDLVLIFLADNRINNSSNNAIKYIFCV